MSTSEINSITIGPRQSNFELLRILAMFLVIVIHADFLSTGLPSPENYYADWLPVTTKVLFESISIVCVNVFILISGWFGIRSSVKSFSQFAFQCLFFYVGLYMLFLIKGDAELSIRGIAQCLCLTKQFFYENYSGLSCLAVMGAALVGIFLLAVLLDQPRKWLWKYLSPKINIKN
jgi:surface polysaccharide O-acyltransferase-like enzyme